MTQSSTLVLVRHGNTFERGQKAFWVGARTNLPLTSEGELQAQSGILHITQKYPWISSLVAGPLLRTTSAASIMAAHIGKEYSVDKRLCEIDYGKWEGLSNAEIAHRYGAEVLDKWDQSGVWPEGMEWEPEYAALRGTLKSFLDEEREKLLATPSTTHVAITSNGILRVIFALATGLAADSSCKVRTGGVCAMTPTEQGWQIVAWDVNPV